MIGITILLPLITAAALLSLRPSRESSAESVPQGPGWTRLEQRVAVLGTLTTLVLSLAILFALHAERSGTPARIVERHEWVPALGVTGALRIDGISVFPFVVTALLFCLTMMSMSYRRRVPGHGRWFLAISLALETSLLGAFAALDAILFVVLLQAGLLCLYSLLLMNGGTREKIGARRLALWTSAGVAGLFLAVLHVDGALVETVATTDLVELGRAARNAAVESGASWLFLLFGAAGGAVLLPLFPAHRWLASAHRECSPPTEILLSGLLGIGVFCFLRLVLPLFPGEAKELAPWLMALTVVSILVAAIGSLLESDAKRLVYRFSVAHLGLALAGLLTFTVEGVVGSLFLLVNHGLATTALYLLLTELEERRLSLRIGETRALGGSMPRYARLLLVVAGSGVGILPACGFVGVYLVTSGLLESGRWGAATLALLGVVIVGASLAGFCFRLLLPFGRAAMRISGTTGDTDVAPRDLRARELGVVLPLATLMVVGGVFSTWFTDRMTPAVHEWLELFK